VLPASWPDAKPAQNNAAPQVTANAFRPALRGDDRRRCTPPKMHSRDGALALTFPCMYATRSLPGDPTRPALRAAWGMWLPWESSVCPGPRERSDG